MKRLFVLFVAMALSLILSGCFDYKNIAKDAAKPGSDEIAEKLGVPNLVDNLYEEGSDDAEVLPPPQGTFVYKYLPPMYNGISWVYLFTDSSNDKEQVHYSFEVTSIMYWSENDWMADGVLKIQESSETLGATRIFCDSHYCVPFPRLEVEFRVLSDIMPGASWQHEASLWRINYQVEDSVRTITVPAGTFEVLCVFQNWENLQSNIENYSITKGTFCIAENVGVVFKELVYIRQQDGDQYTHKYELVEYR